ncbi:uncharacterized protein SPAPADRAFT_143881, partial [Spathaspora passalidarum NRRL Y-27907]
GFDPKKLKVAELRNILNRHGVEYASNARKTQLVELFQDNITTKRDELIKELNVKGSDEGIVSVDLDSSTTAEENSGGNMDEAGGAVVLEKIEDSRQEVFSPNSVKIPNFSPTTKTSPKVSSETKKRKLEEDEDKPDASVEEETPSKKIPKRLKPIKHEIPKRTIFDDTESDIDMEVFPKVSPATTKHEKRTPKSSSKATPNSSKGSHNISPKTTPSKVSKPSSKKTTPHKASSSKSANTSVNESFQSIAEEEHHFDQELSKIKEKAASPSADEVEFAKSLGITIEGFQPPQPPFAEPASHLETPKKSPVFDRSFLTPKPRLIPISTKDTDESDDDDDDDDEEEEKTEVQKVVVEEKQGKVQTTTTSELPELSQEHSQSLSRRSLTQALMTFFIWAIIVASGLFFYWYIEQSYMVGYCGQEIHNETFGNIENPILRQVGKFLDDNAKPSCVPCPPHGRCFPNLELACYEDFIEYRPWNNFIKPGNKKCIPDTKKAEKLEIMMEVALDLIRSKNAQVQCGRGVDDFESGISVQDLHDLLLEMKAPYITLEEFEELWERSVVELEKEPEIIVRQKSPNFPKEFSNINDSNSHEETDKVLRSTSLSNISLNCQISNSLMGGLAQYKPHLFICTALFILFKYVQYQYNQYRLQLLKVDILHREVVSKLVNQMKQFQSGEAGFGYIGANQLRDLILASEDNLKSRIKLWGLVSEKVEKNTNVKVEVIEHHGEMMKIWKWIGV